VTPVQGGPLIVAVVGPTAVGKTALAVRIAAAVGGEIVGADSRQVYRYLDIGTGKPTAAEQALAPHHMIDVVRPDEPFDVADYRGQARHAIADIAARGRPVVLCGGTGLYVRAVLHGLFRGPKAAPALRLRLAAEDEPPGTLHRRLADCDPEAAARIHWRDRARVVRALEVFELTGRPISAWQRDHGFGETPYRSMVLGLVRERDALRAAIAARCDEMVRLGLPDEVRGLWERGYGPELAPLRTLGYRHMGAYVRGERTLADALADMVRETCRYAKRQLTWFRHDAHVRWFDVGTDTDGALRAACRFIADGGTADAPTP
jgi:tRNA dimethylallyltransferase